MGMEIERKFLLQSDGWRGQVQHSERMRQGYLNQEKHCSVRVRTAGGRAWLNIKGVTVGAQRKEFEYEIPLADALELLETMSHRPLIEKTRHYVPAGGRVWEIDEFDGENAGLVVAELELDDPDEPFVKPDWLGEEVTDDVRYYNTQLVRQPYRQWSSGDA